MSFTRLLAAGRSVMGIKKQPGPYRMNQDHLLPKFAPAPRQAAVDSALLPEAAVVAIPAAEPMSVSSLEGRSIPAQLANRRWAFKSESQPNIFSRLAKRLFGWRGSRNSSPSKPAGGKGRPVQAELCLEGVKVVRNDLRDSDAEASRKARPAAPVMKWKSAPAQQRTFGMVWNRLSARLLRQAAQEFSLVQKERGKLLSHAGDDGGSAGSP